MKYAFHYAAASPLAALPHWYTHSILNVSTHLSVTQSLNCIPLVRPLHCVQSMRCGLLLQLSHGLSVCLCVHLSDLDPGSRAVSSVA